MSAPNGRGTRSIPRDSSSHSGRCTPLAADTKPTASHKERARLRSSTKSGPLLFCQSLFVEAALYSRTRLQPVLGETAGQSGVDAVEETVGCSFERAGGQVEPLLLAVANGRKTDPV